jgi:radical SAM superfamily enzyme YgiQ (UPF0313 family)
MKTYPLNLLYLATFVRISGRHDAVVVDCESAAVAEKAGVSEANRDPGLMIHEGIPGMVEIIQDPDHPLWSEIERQILAHDPDIVGVTSCSGNLDAVRHIVRRIKRRGLPVILGGSHPTSLPEQSINYTSADMVAVGEGEGTLLDVLDAMSSHADLGSIPSLALRRDRGVLVNPRRPLINPMDSLPIPDRSMINRAEYFGEVLMTGRGCPFNCSYCASRNIWGRRVRLRSVQSIIEELQSFTLDCDPDGSLREPTCARTDLQRPGRWVVKIVDDTFTVNKNRTIQLLDQIVEHGLNRFEFTGGVRADTLDDAVVQKMQRANFRRVTLGVESGSPKILEQIRKGETNEQVKRAIELLRQAGIHSHAFFMIGFPGETADDVELSKKLILESRPDYVEINMATPYPGADLFDELVPEDPSTIDRWYRWFHQGLSTHSERLGFDLDKAYEDFLDFASDYNGAH